MPAQVELQARSMPNRIFISYSRRDKGWVNDYLTPLLTAAEVPFTIDEQDFEIGKPLDESIRNSVLQCPYVLFVMTPDWVDRKWTHYESELALKEVLAAEDRRILPIKLRHCNVPPHIASRLFLDLCAARQRDKEIVKLLQQIGVSADGIVKALNSVAKKTLLLLIELLEEPSVREKVSKLREMFLQIQHGNEVLVSNKQLHDDLHTIQQTFSQLPADISLSSAGAIDWMQIRKGQSALSEQIDKLIDRAAAITDELVDVTFVERFKGLSDDLDSAVQARDARRYAAYLSEISRQLDRSLPRVNDRIVQHVKDRRLEALVDCLQEVYEEVADIEFDAQTTALLAGFRAGIGKLVELDKTIRERVDDHRTLQDAEMDFQQMIRDGEATYYDISIHWNRIGIWIGKLKFRDRYERLFRSFEQLSQQLRDDQCVRDDKFEEAVKWSFSGLASETRKAFNRLDIDLLEICKGLKPHGDDLQKILDRMHSYEGQS